MESQSNAQSSPIDLENLRRFLSTRPDVIAAYLFGSVARGRAGPRSDVDIAVLLEEGLEPFERFERRLRLMGELEAFCGREVDVVVLNDVTPVLQHQVLRYGRLLYEKDHMARVAFEVQVQRTYADLKPMYEFHTRVLFKRIKEVGLGWRKRGHSQEIASS